MLRVGAFVALPKVLSRLGLAIEPILDDLNLPRDLLATSDNVFDVQQAGRLLHLSATQSGCAHIGVLLGQTASPGTLGLPGLLMQSSPNLGAALKSIVMTLEFNGRAVIPHLSMELGTVAFGITMSPSVEAGRPIGQDLSLTIACQLIRSLVGSNWIPSEVRIAHHAPADCRPYDRYFGVNVTFDAERSALIFPSIWLDKPVATADQRARRRIEKLLAARASSDVELVLFCRRAIVALIVQQNFSVAGVAATMKLHPRTLNRRLAMLGTSVAGLAKEVRFAIARHLLTDTSLPVAEIASTLGYSEGSTFIRRFRSWAGTTPAAWRQRNVIQGIGSSRDLAQTDGVSSLDLAILRT